MSAKEIMRCNYRLPEGALPGQFCSNHIVSEQNPEGTDCALKLTKGDSTCPYLTPDEAINGPLEDGTRGKACVDFVVRNFGPDSAFVQ